jgi:hypothetical protein
MEKNGYVLALHGLELPANWTQKTTEMNTVYSNELTKIYAGVSKP